MKKLIVFILILSTGITYGQWPSLNLYSAAGQVQIRNNITYAVNRGCDSLGKVFDAKLKLLEASFDKKLKDSMALTLPIDGKTIVSLNGKATAVGGGTTDLKPVYDTISKNKAEQAIINQVLTNNINIVSGRVTTVENKVSALESWRVTVTAQLVTINSSIATLNTDLQNTKKTIPIIDVTYPAVAKVKTEGGGYLIDENGNAVLASEWLKQHPITFSDTVYRLPEPFFLKADKSLTIKID